MIRPYELFVGLRYTRAKRRNHFISFISLSSILGTALGVTALITVLSVMNGFDKELRDRILGVTSSITIHAVGGPMHDWRSVAGAVQGMRGVTGIAPYVEGEGMLTHGRVTSGVVVRGILPSAEPRVTNIGGKIVAGSLRALKPGRFGIVLGRELAWKLGVDIGSHVMLIAPEGEVTPAGLLPRLRRFTVVGIFDVGMYEYDTGLAFIQLDDAARLYQMPQGISGLRIKLADIYRAPATAQRMARRLGPGFRVRDWTEEHANFFRALKMEKTVMFVILLLIVAVAAFNIVSTLVMVVTDKEAEIAILRTLGASPASIMGIFMIQGSVIGVVGTLIGAVCGVTLALNVVTIVPFLERVFHTTFLSSSVYYISQLPSHLKWTDVVTVSSVSLAMGFLATIYPAWRAAQTQPAEALRYE
ncbi:MAG: lipoprotein-releasing ABC transporter permease subunit [Pseudomonadota bacterium]|nr:lipoprotein-releasing ABC transporter permease subunit [Pseudomonadota bacterium]